MAALPPPPDAPLAPGLYVVATPIGNLRDITLRALDVLAGCDRVLAEDTRVAAKLLSAYGLSKPVERYDDHSDARVRERVLERLAAGERLALTSDAGTPLISDPGYRLVRTAREAGHAVIPVPGASAVMAALSAAGLPTDRFLFAGFAPTKSAARRTAFAELAALPATLVIYETGPRLHASLRDMADVFGADRPAAVCRELTKRFETFVSGALSELVTDPALAEPKGEIVVLVGAGREGEASEADLDAALTEALSRLSPADAAGEVARAFGAPRRDLYRRALALKGAAP